MENFDPDMYVTPHRAPPQYSDNLQTPPSNDQRFYHEKVDVRKIGARKKLVNIFQNPMFGQPVSAQPSTYRPWSKDPQAEKSKLSPYLKNKANGLFHSMKQTSPKVQQIHFFL